MIALRFGVASMSDGTFEAVITIGDQQPKVITDGFFKTRKEARDVSNAMAKNAVKQLAAQGVEFELQEIV
jgi:hypothetical protein